ncbi:MAG: hypothetical protein HRU11_12310, partial [Parvularculaceae bacterium]|nr:hypothetical protein [Parvularculaceae bacterium]
MNDEQRNYELEMARELDADERTPEQRQMLAQMAHANTLDSERREAVNYRRASGVDDRLVLSHGLYEGQRDSNGKETFDRKVEMPDSGNRVYFNITRQITNDGAAQLGDLLFPNDDRNYGLNPGPIAEPPLALQQEPAVNKKGEPLLDEQGQPLTNMQAHRRRVDRAQRKCKRMFKKLDASLIASRYPTKARKIIHHAAMYGTGIIKGPVPVRESKGRWAKKADGGYAVRAGEGLKAEVSIVSPFDFFPDGSATDVDECRYIWERTYMEPAALEKAHGFRQEAVRRLLDVRPLTEETETEDIREEAKSQQTGEKLSDGRFVVWERRGTVPREVLESFDVDAPGKDRFFDAVVYMCQGEILRVVVNKFENKDPIYSVFCWDEDPLGIFGYGIPWLIRDPQATYVAAWRMALDNGGISAMPQIVLDQSQIKPIDGKMELRGGKLWQRTGDTINLDGKRPAFEVFNINQNLNELWAMMDRAVDDSYELSGVTRVEKSQGGLDNAPVTLGATQILQNNTTVSRRALARRWDDDVTLGLITRFYDFFMQQDPDDDIKAHMVVEPRGASVLLAKELQASNLMQLYQMTGGGQAEGVKSVELLRGIAGVMQVPEGKFIETEDEYDQRIAAEQEQGAQPSVEEQIALRQADVDEANVELAQGRLQLDTAVADHKQQLEWATL